MGFCPSHKAVCHRPGADPLCISKDKFCDGINHCHQGHDERNCPVRTTRTKQGSSTRRSTTSTRNPNVTRRPSSKASTRPSRTTAQQPTVVPTSNNVTGTRVPLRNATEERVGIARQGLQGVQSFNYDKFTSYNGGSGIHPSVQTMAAVVGGVVSLLILSLIVIIWLHGRKKVIRGNIVDGSDSVTHGTASATRKANLPQVPVVPSPPLLQQVFQPMNTIDEEANIYEEIPGTETDQQPRPHASPTVKLPQMVHDDSDSSYTDVIAGAHLHTFIRTVRNDLAAATTHIEHHEETNLKTRDGTETRDSASYVDVKFPDEIREFKSYFERNLKAPSFSYQDEQHQYMSLGQITPRQSGTVSVPSTGYQSSELPSSGDWQPVDANDAVLDVSDNCDGDYLTPANARLLPQQPVSINDDVPQSHFGSENTNQGIDQNSDVTRISEEHRVTNDYLNPVFLPDNSVSHRSEPDNYINPVSAPDNNIGNHSEPDNYIHVADSTDPGSIPVPVFDGLMGSDANYYIHAV